MHQTFRFEKYDEKLFVICKGKRVVDFEKYMIGK